MRCGPVGARWKVPGSPQRWHSKGTSALRVRVMRLHDTVLRMRELLKENHVELTPAHADAEEVYEGPGENARHAWRAFCAVALEPAFDPVDPGEGELELVAHAGLHFTAS